MPNCLRREVRTGLTGKSAPSAWYIFRPDANCAVDDQRRKLNMRHARSETFLKDYISSSVVDDVQATFLNQDFKSNVINEMGMLTLRRDSNLGKESTDAQKNQAC